MEINEFEILSVGVDVGSSTSHLVFSSLFLKKDERSETRRFKIQERNIIYEGRIINTPLLDDCTIDVDRLTEFFKAEYKRAGIEPDDIQTGAVIVTGESARKQNAKQIVEALSNDTGKFVAATAGPNFESLIAAMGSGAAARSKKYNKTILSCDIGGGTSNIAVLQNGETLSTSCISVGGRLLGINPNGKIWRLDEPALKVMKYLGLNYKKGDLIPQEDIEKTAKKFVEILFEVITGPAKSPLAQQLMLTDDLQFPSRIDEYSFSGGVAELMYGGANHYKDIGQILANHINTLTPALTATVVEPANKIRATVIGAGAYSLSISGSSCFMDDQIAFPIRNVPVIRVDVDRSKLSFEHILEQINISFRRFDLKEGEDIVALYFKDPVMASYPQLELFAKSIEAALADSIRNKMPIILIFETDIACGVGNVIRRETDLKTNLLTLDELNLKEGDWVDIGEPLVAGQVFPVTVKSLVFH
ncbi:MAG: ethanolamine ammonia-lyase reactivating factor EutA [Deltaproteobacteria bacterium]|jgi:ethanolamine utilization protein EutA|nr:ethanolamine ammonia-lyase reactivating factor EutA [Deltaproteobacteria bacterium]